MSENINAPSIMFAQSLPPLDPTKSESVDERRKRLLLLSGKEFGRAVEQTVLEMIAFTRHGLTQAERQRVIVQAKEKAVELCLRGKYRVPIDLSEFVRDCENTGFPVPRECDDQLAKELKEHGFVTVVYYEGRNWSKEVRNHECEKCKSSQPWSILRMLVQLLTSAYSPNDGEEEGHFHYGYEVMV